MGLGRLLFELGAELWHEYRRRRRAQAAAEAWARTPATPRGCPRCLELAYSPGQVRCFRCGSELTPPGQ